MDTKYLARTAMLTALGVVLISLSGMLPTARIALAGMAGILPAVIVVRDGPGRAYLLFVASALLAALVAPDKGSVLLYALFFGHYPMAKCYIERLGKLVLEWALKLILCNSVVTLCTAAFSMFFTGEFEALGGLLPVVYAVTNIAFVVYDIGFSKLIAFYVKRMPVDL